MSDHLASAPIPVSALALGLAGLIPFAAGALALWAPLPILTSELGLKLIVTYGAIILSFLGGIRWGTAIGPYDGGRMSFEFSASVLGSLAGLAAVFLPSVPALTLLVAGFLIQALWDVTSVEAGRLPNWFGKLRMVLTAGAVISLVAALIAVVVI
jgi:hypothetical protein